VQPGDYGKFRHVSVRLSLETKRACTHQDGLLCAARQQWILIARGGYETPGVTEALLLREARLGGHLLRLDDAVRTETLPAGVRRALRITKQLMRPPIRVSFRDDLS
jgi:hypothetical protein